MSLPRRELPRARRPASRTCWVSGRVELASGFKKAQEDRAAAGLAAGSVRSRREVDVASTGAASTDMKNQKAAWRKATPTNAQVREIRRQGIDVDWSKMNAGQVSDMLDFRKAQAAVPGETEGGNPLHSVQRMPRRQWHPPLSIVRRSGNHWTRMFAHAPTRRPLRASRAPPGTLLSHLNALQGSRLRTRATVGGTHSPATASHRASAEDPVGRSGT